MSNMGQHLLRIMGPHEQLYSPAKDFSPAVPIPGLLALTLAVEGIVIGLRKGRVERRIDGKQRTSDSILLLSSCG